MEEFYDLNVVDGIHFKYVDCVHVISDQGVMYRENKGKLQLMKTGTKPNWQGYCVSPIKGFSYMHQIVAEYFLQPGYDKKKYEINHKDLNKANNAVSNLELVTRKENSRHYHNTMKSLGLPSVNHVTVKSKRVGELDSTGTYVVREFNSIKEAGRTLAKEMGEPKKWNSIAVHISYSLSKRKGCSTVHGKKFILLEPEKSISNTVKSYIEQYQEWIKEANEKKEEPIEEGIVVIRKYNPKTDTIMTIEEPFSDNKKIDLKELSEL